MTSIFLDDPHNPVESLTPAPQAPGSQAPGSLALDRYAGLGRPRSGEKGAGSLAAFAFVDLTIGPARGDADFTGGPYRSMQVHESHLDLIDRFRAEVLQAHAEKGQDSFRLDLDGVRYRIQRIDSVEGHWWSCRRLDADIRQIDGIGLEPWVRDYLRRCSGVPGMLFIIGEQGAGKTTLAAAHLIDNLRRLGGLAVSVESPVEIPLQGRHGPGRCLQQEVGREEDVGLYLGRALRQRSRILFLGETRWRAQADQLLLSATAGIHTLTSFHGTRFGEAIDRFVRLADPERPAGAAALLSSCLLGMVRIRYDHASGRTESDLLAPTLAVKSRIRAMDFAGLDNDVQHLRQTRGAVIQQDSDLVERLKAAGAPAATLPQLPAGAGTTPGPEDGPEYGPEYRRS